MGRTEAFYFIDPEQALEVWSCLSQWEVPLWTDLRCLPVALKLCTTKKKNTSYPIDL